MNKKVFILPLAVAAMGLASCNKAWPTITDEESKTIVSNITNIEAIKKYLESQDISGFDKIASFTITQEAKDTICKGIKRYQNMAVNSNLNLDKNYYKLSMSGKVISGEGEGEQVASSNVYITHKDTNAYILFKESSIGTAIPLQEDAAKTMMKRSFYNGLDFAVNDDVPACYFDVAEMAYYMLSDWDNQIAKFKEQHELYKDDKEFHFNYALRSNDKKDSIQLVLDSKTQDGILPKVNAKTEENVYAIEQIDCTFVHGLVTKMSYTTEYKTKEDGVEKIEMQKVALTANFGSASVDNINLDDYQIVKDL